MGFHRLTYPIFQIPKVVERGEPRVVFRYGWTNEGRNFGFFNAGKSWVATDLRSGRVITRQATRKACVEWIEAHADELEAKFATEEYAQWVAEFEAAKEEYNYG